MKKLRIFVSSVQKELETERVAVAGAVSSDQVLSRHCEIVLFEKEALSGLKVAKPYLECQERLRVSKVTATKDLSVLVGYGLAERVGEGRSVRYVYSGGNR